MEAALRARIHYLDVTAEQTVALAAYGRRPHVSGAPGAAMLNRFIELKWVAPLRHSRAMRVTAPGRGTHKLKASLQEELADRARLIRAEVGQKIEYLLIGT